MRVCIERRKRERERLASTGERGFHFWSEKCIFGQGGGNYYLTCKFIAQYWLVSLSIAGFFYEQNCKNSYHQKLKKLISNAKNSYQIAKTHIKIALNKPLWTKMWLDLYFRDEICTNVIQKWHKNSKLHYKMAKTHLKDCKTQVKKPKNSCQKAKNSYQKPKNSYQNPKNSQLPGFRQVDSGGFC